MKKLFTLLMVLTVGAISNAFAQHNVTFKVDMNKYVGTIGKVYVSGTLNGWSGDANELTDANSDGIYEGTIAVTLDSVEFKFTMNNWAVQESFSDGDPCTITKGGFTNRYLISAVDTTLDVYCWNACTDCSQVQDASDVTFRVDMTEYSGTGSAYLNGDFNGWCGTCNPMADADMDGIWEVTIPLTNDSIEYKFTVDGWTDQESLTPGMPCTKTTGGFTNRFLILDGSVALPAVCFNSCSGCATSPKNNTTFKVDMSQYSGTYGTVNLNGDFNGWCGGCATMFDNDGDKIYELVIPLGDSIEYKFTVDGWTGQENFTAGSACTKTTGEFTNRFAKPDGDTDLGVVCWESCDSCTTTPEGGDVTFKVDMSMYSGSWTNINLNGTFNGWCGACAPMTDDDMDSIYEITINIPFDTIEWKFTIDGWTAQEEFEGGETCTKTTDGFTNRYMIFTADTTLGVVCFNSCKDCESLVGINEADFSRLNIYPNPAEDVLNIDLKTQNGNDILSISVVDMVGNTIYANEINASSATKNINVSDYAQGVYSVLVSTTNGQYTKRVIIR